MIESIISATGMTLGEAAICTGTSLVLGFIIAFVYSKLGNYTKNFAVTLSLLPVLVQIVIMMVNGSIGMGIAIMGAFSLVRFRSVPGSSREIVSVFFAMSVGLATGTGYVYFAAAVTAVICVVMILLCKVPVLEVKQGRNKELRITVPENLDYTVIFEDLFQKYTKKCNLVRVKTINLGSLFELRYSVVLKDNKLQKELIDDLRVRNGNLPIVLAEERSSGDEL